MQKPSLIIVLFICLCTMTRAQNEKWDLNKCISHARENNVDVIAARLQKETSSEEYIRSKADLLPQVDFISGQNFSYTNSQNQGIYTGTYGVQASMDFTFGKKLNTIKQRKLEDDIASIELEQTKDNLELSIIQAYIEILYAQEAVKSSESSLNVSRKQLERAEQLLKSGSISQVDYALLESQTSNYEYQLVQAENTLSQTKLNLKQLLELQQDIDIEYIDIKEEDILVVSENVENIYRNAVGFLPQILSARNGIETAKLELSNAKADFLPSISLSAGINTGNSTANDIGLMRQLKDGFYENIGLNISIPIYSKRNNRTNLNKAKINIMQSENQMRSVEKQVYKTIDELHLELLNYQSAYKAAKVNLEASQKSYELLEQQYNVGLKNTVELLTESNNLFLAKQNLLQTKYQALIRIQLLKYYQNQEMGL